MFAGKDQHGEGGTEYGNRACPNAAHSVIGLDVRQRRLDGDPNAPANQSVCCQVCLNEARATELSRVACMMKSFSIELCGTARALVPLSPIDWKRSIDGRIREETIRGGPSGYNLDD
jgi:hypothetical protein